jgi:hypothetical protein
MDREQRIVELRAEIAVHERVIEDGEAGCYMNITGPDDEKRACRRYEKHRKSVPSDQAKTESLAEVRAELSALEQREPTIEERFPVGSRWRTKKPLFPLGRSALCELYELTGDGAFFRSCHDGRHVAAPLFINVAEFFERLDDTPPAQPVDPRNICDEGFMFCGDCAPCRDLVASAPTKPAPACEAPGYAGPEHPVDADEYLVCRVCRASESDRRRERRRRFDAWPVDVTQFPAVRGEPRFGARSVSDEWDVYGELMPTRELAVAALFEKMERAR